jgi:2,3-bisphosphoglycerate-dependent phosphoglycerate mutase
MADRIYLIRHAQSFPSSKIAERLWPLSDHGHRQAEGLAPLLETLGIARAVSSPYLRCVDTIGPYTRRRGLELTIREPLHERILAPSVRTDFRELQERSWSDRDFALPECESSREAQSRFVGEIEAVASEEAGTVGVCAHGNVIGLLLDHLRPDLGRSAAERLRNPDVVCLNLARGRLVWDSAFALDGLDAIATDASRTPIDW